ncbi:hypothetical protein GOODEAATRI_034356, partial [Goodea atripinnis]
PIMFWFCSNQSHLMVTEELHIIRFVAVLHHAGETLDIEASSLPVVVISSSNQVPSAWASIMWFNMLSTSEPMVRKANFIRANKNNQPLLNQSELKNAWLCPAEPVPVCRSSSALLAAAGAASELAVSVHGPAAT